MNRQISIIILLSFLATACGDKKTYRYIETVDEVRLTGGTDRREKQPKIITASSDSSAYLEAYKMFCISMKVYNDMRASLGNTHSKPQAFKIYDEQRNDLSNISFATKAIREKEIQDEVFSLKNSIQESVDQLEKDKQESFKATANIDTNKIDQLKKSFRIKADEFSNKNKKWYTPKSAPVYANANGIYLYFQSEEGIPGNLRFRLQYYNDDWLFFSRVQFLIDGKAYEYTPLDTETDSGDGGYIWEWFDESVAQPDKELLYALANAKSAKMKLIGRQYYDVKTISPAQINAIKKTIELYEAMGGQY